VINTQFGCTSQVDGSDSDSSVFSFSVITPTISYSGDSEWMIDTGATYHVYPNRDWFSSFKKLDGYTVVMGDDCPCHMKGIGTVLTKMFDWMVRELNDVRYVPQLKRNLITIGALEALGLKVSIRDRVLKMVKGSMVVLKGVRHNNVYYLNGSTVTGQVATSTNSYNDCTQLWHMRLGHIGEKYLQVFAKQGLLKGASACKLKFCEHCIIGKKTKEGFRNATHYTEEILDYVHIDV